MSPPNIISISVSPYEILFPGSKIIVEVDTSLDPKCAQSAITVRGQKGIVRLKDKAKIAIWETEKPLPPGNHVLIIDELCAENGMRFDDEIVIPFFVLESTAKVPSNLLVRSITRLRVQDVDFERLPTDSLPSGKYVEMMKAIDRETGTPVELAFDEKGQRIDGQEVLVRVVKNRDKQFGKLHESLYKRIKDLDDDSLLDVAIWLRSPTLSQERLKRLKTKSSRLPSQIIKFRKAQARKVNRFSNQLEKFLDVRNIRQDSLAPIVYLELTKSQIKKVEKMSEILAIFLHEVDGINDLQNSLAISNATIAHKLGYKGIGVRVAVWEDGPDDTSDLIITAFYDTNQSSRSEHARLTHAIVKNKEKNNPKGYAPSCRLYSANDTKLAALRWAVKDKNCTVISQSFHRASEPASSSLSFDDIYKDWLILNWPYPTIIQAAGNYWDGDTDGIDPPSDEYVNHKGYNSLTVGNHNDNASGMSASSVFRNPSTMHSDRELPEICANGTTVTAAGSTQSGTSFATPAVAGCATLIQNVNPILKSWPEGCRAILLAGAKRNVTGNTWWQDNLANVDTSDGSGSIDAYESVRISQSKRSRNAAATLRGWDVGTLRSSNFGVDSLSNFSYKVKVPDNWIGPLRVKVALAWNSKVDALVFSGIELPLYSFMTVDFDLEIFDSSGNIVGYSGSWDNSYEIAEFDGIPGETYTIRVRRYSGIDSTWYGIAWTVTGVKWIYIDRIARRDLLFEEIQARTLARRR